MNCPLCGAESLGPRIGDGKCTWWKCESYGPDNKVKHQSELCCEAEEHNETKAKLAVCVEALRGASGYFGQNSLPVAVAIREALATVKE